MKIHSTLNRVGSMSGNVIRWPCHRLLNSSPAGTLPYAADEDLQPGSRRWTTNRTGSDARENGLKDLNQRILAAVKAQFGPDSSEWCGLTRNPKLVTRNCRDEEPPPYFFCIGHYKPRSGFRPPAQRCANALRWVHEIVGKAQP